jgi:hypothetical protein
VHRQLTRGRVLALHRLAAGFFSLAFCVALHASVTERAVGIAEKFANEALRETYGLDAVSLSVRTEQFAAGTAPERFWITVSSQPKPCDSGAVADELGEIYVQFVKNRLYSIEWLPVYDPKVRAAETTRARMLKWLRGVWELDKQLSEKSVPSEIPTQHLKFSLRNKKGTITIILDREYGFVHHVYWAAE